MPDGNASRINKTSGLFHIQAIRKFMATFSTYRRMQLAIDLIRNPGAPILHIDDAAFLKAMFFQEVAHDGIVPVGVDADIGNPGHAVGQAFPENAFPGVFT